jgi:hypothetical protein
MFCTCDKSASFFAAGESPLAVKGDLLDNFVAEPLQLAVSHYPKQRLHYNR